jgi:flagellin
MRINTNVASLNAQAQGSQTNSKLSSSLEKLSSGLRINKASDDASGMSIADKLRTQASSIGQGIANANSGSALIQIADKAMAEQSNILDIVKTKLIQAATSTTSAEGREAVRKDIGKLLEQFDNISEQTNYNGTNLLDKKNAEFSFQVGEDSSFDIGLSTAYAVNTKGLGSASSSDASGKATVGYGADGIIMKGSADSATTTTVKTSDGAILIGNTAVTTAPANNSDASFSFKANSVTGFAVKGTLGGGVVLSTTDKALISALDSLDSAEASLTKVSEGVYTFNATAAAGKKLTFNNSEKVDISNLTVSSITNTTLLASSDHFAIFTTKDVTITKESGSYNMDIDSSSTGLAAIAGGMVGTTDPTTADGIDYVGNTLMLRDGVMTVKSDTTSQDHIVLNYDQTATVSQEDLDMTINAKDVKKITIKMTAGSASVVFNTDNAAMLAKLNELEANQATLTKTDAGFVLTTGTVNSDVALDFGSGFDISSLQISGVKNGTAVGASEAIYIETLEAVTITNNSTSTATNTGDISIITSSSTANGATGHGTALTGVAISSSYISKNLEGLTTLGENGLTADLANSFMAVIDEAMTQLNSVRSDFGSTQGQLEVATRNMMSTQVNLKAAESVIRDVDYAQESATFNKQNIIAQAGTYAMSQANAMQQNVLRLLQ